MDASKIHPDHHLITDLGLDSLTTSTLPLWVEEQFGTQIDDGAQIALVRDVVLAGMGLFHETGALRDMTVPKRWIETTRRAPRFISGTQTLVAGFFRQRDRMGGSAVCMGDDRAGVLTYSQAAVKTIVLARHIKKSVREDVVGMMLPASVGATLVSLATLLAGKRLAPLNWTNGRAALDHSIELAGVKTIFTSDLFLDKANVEMSESTLTKVVPLESLKGKLGLKDLLTAWMIARCKARGILWWMGYDAKTDDVAVVLFTSGSESAPKGVPLTHRNILCNIEGAIGAIGGKPNDVMYGFLPPFHSFGMSMIQMLSVVGGVKVAFDPDPKKFRHLAHGAQRWQATLVAGTPDFLTGILNAGEAKNFTTVRAMLSGAQKAPAALRERLQELGIDLLEGYGITETAPLVAVNRPGETPAGVGRAITGVEIVIVNPAQIVTRDGADATLDASYVMPEGTEGLILVHGPNVFEGYLGNVKSPFVIMNGKRYYNTGDLGIMRHGNLTISGRQKRFLKFAGEMISLPAIEDALIARWPARDAGPVVTVDGEERDNEKPLICLYTTDPMISLEEAHRVLKAAGLPPLAYPRQIHVLSEIPLLGTGKTNYRALPRPSELAHAA